MTVQSILVRAGAGAAGGLVGTVFMLESMQHKDALPDAAQPPAQSDDPGHFMVSRAEDLVGTAVSPTTRRAAAGSLHWAYGLTWGTAFGLIAPALGVQSWGSTLAAGAGMGVLCWGTGYLGWMPAAGLVQPIQRQGTTHVLSALASHVLFGMLVAVPAFAIQRALTRRPLFR